MTAEAEPAVPDELGAFAAELLDDAPCGIASTDPNGEFILVNRTMAGWVGLAPDALIGAKRMQDLLTVPGRIFYETHIAPMIRLQGFAREIACHIGRTGSPPLPVLLNAVLRSDGDGRPQRIDWTVFDATERNLYETSLREARSEAEQLAAVVRTSPNAILRVGPRGEVMRWNRSAESLFGVRAEDAVGRRVDELIELLDRKDWFAAAAKEAIADGGARFEAVHPSGLVLDITISRIGEEKQTARGRDFSIILRDVSAQAEARKHLALLVGELNHRVKNTLGVVLSIARQTIGRGDTEESVKFHERIAALARAHDLLTGNHWEGAELGDLISLVAAGACGPNRLRSKAIKLALPPKHATTLSIALHELATNALKYGSLSTPEGWVELDCDALPDDPGRVSLTWRERNGPKVKPPGRRGFGSALIERAVAAEFRGVSSLDFNPAGVVYRLEFPRPEQYVQPV